MLRTVAALRIVQGTSLARHVAKAPGASFHTTTELRGMHRGQTHFPKNFGKPTGKESFHRPTQAMVRAERSYWLDRKKVPITLDPKTSNEAISRFFYYEFLRQSSYEFTRVANTIRSWRGTILQQYMGRAYVDLDLKMPFNLITQSEKSLERPSLALNETQVKKAIRAQHLYYNLVDNINRDPVLAASILDSLNEKYPSNVKLTVEKMAETDPIVNMTPSAFSTATKYALGRERGIKVFPDVIDSFDPYVRLKVVYKAVVQDGDLKSVAKNYEKKEGEEVEDILLEGHRAQDLQLVPSLALNEPLIEFSRYVSKSRPFYHPNHETDPTVFYTLLLVDADEPARNVSPNQQRLHWLVGNIPDANFVDGETLASYIPPVPASGTRLHRYAFILLEQLKGRVDYSDFTKLDSKSLSPRDNFSVRTFAEKYNLHGRGASAFHAEWDSSVTETYKTFTDVEKEPRFMLASKWARFSDRLPIPSTRYILPWGTGLADIKHSFQEIRRIREQV